MLIVTTATLLCGRPLGCIYILGRYERSDSAGQEKFPMLVRGLQLCMLLLQPTINISSKLTVIPSMIMLPASGADCSQLFVVGKTQFLYLRRCLDQSRQPQRESCRGNGTPLHPRAFLILKQQLTYISPALSFFITYFVPKAVKQPLAHCVHVVMQRPGRSSAVSASRSKTTVIPVSINKHLLDKSYKHTQHPCFYYLVHLYCNISFLF